jgi:hypothetical protein
VNWEEMLALSEASMLGDASMLESINLSHTTGLNQSLCSSIAYGFKAFEAFEELDQPWRLLLTLLPQPLLLRSGSVRRVE